MKIFKIKLNGELNLDKETAKKKNGFILTLRVKNLPIQTKCVKLFSNVIYNMKR